MRKIPSLFKRDYEGTRLVYDEPVEGSEWVLAGEGVATRKWDGTACMVRGGVLYKRYDRKQKKGKFKPAPEGWEPCEPEPNEHTGHWPGWVPVSDAPEDQYFREAFRGDETDGTYELVGPKVQGNPEGFPVHMLVPHGEHPLPDAPRTYEALKEWLSERHIEGIVWHHPDGRLVKIKAKNFGINRPF